MSSFGKTCHVYSPVLTLLAETPPRIDALTAGLAPAQLHTTPNHDGWSANDVLAHLRACADVWGNCIVAMIEGDRPVLRAVNPRTWIKKTDYYLDPQEREAILKKRLVYLQGCLDYLHTIQQMADEGDCAPGTGISMSNAQRVLAFHLQRVRHEYQWVVTWLKEMQANQS